MRKSSKNIPDRTIADEVRRMDENTEALEGFWRPGDVVQTVSAANRSTPRPGFLLCDGSEYPVGEHPALFKAIGRSFGGDVTRMTFRVPDMQNRYLKGCPNLTAVGGFVPDGPQSVYSVTSSNDTFFVLDGELWCYRSQTASRKCYRKTLGGGRVTAVGGINPGGNTGMFVSLRNPPSVYWVKLGPRLIEEDPETLPNQDGATAHNPVHYATTDNDSLTEKEVLPGDANNPFPQMKWGHLRTLFFIKT